MFKYRLVVKSQENTVCLEFERDKEIKRFNLVRKNLTKKLGPKNYNFSSLERLTQ